MNPHLRQLILKKTVERRRYITPQIEVPKSPAPKERIPYLPLDGEPFLRRLTPLVFDHLLAHQVTLVRPAPTPLQRLCRMGLKRNHRGQWEQAIDQTPVQMRARPLKTWTLLPVDCYETSIMLTEMLAADIATELDADLLGLLWQHSQAWTSAPDGYGRAGQYHTTLWRDIFRAAWMIDRQTNDNLDMFCVINTDAYGILMRDVSFTPVSPSYFGASGLVGTLGYYGHGGFKVYHNRMLPAHQHVLVGGKREGHAGMIYLPHALRGQLWRDPYNFEVAESFCHYGAYVPMLRTDGWFHDVSEFYIGITID